MSMNHYVVTNGVGGRGGHAVIVEAPDEEAALREASMVFERSLRTTSEAFQKLFGDKYYLPKHLVAQPILLPYFCELV